ncbi:putative RNA-directed DNA polymerase [Tanacetum coccineum]
MSRHTTNKCFELIGYPDWWNDGHKKGNKNQGLERGKASAANTGTDQKKSTGLGGMAATTVNEEDGSFSISTTQNYNINQKQSWIFDCGAIDTMTYDLSDFATSTKPTKSYIHTANGEKMNVRNGGTIEISPTIKLSNCLYVPALSHKLLSISHVKKELNCSAIMQPTFCILQDIRTGAIIRRGTERQGLYYVYELTTSGTVMLAHGTSEREAWLWHRRLGHPSDRVPPKRYSLEKVSRGSRYPIANIAKGNLSEKAKAFALSMYSDEIPANTEQALKSKHWKDAMEEEIKALIKNNRWEKRVLPPGKKTVGCRWVFTIKYKPDGTIERYKARLVANGYTQTCRNDYSETFSPVAKINTIRVLISIAANKGWPLHQFDVKNAFLHGELKEEIYMEAPRGFTDNFGEREVCLLKKSLYGLKQSPRAWFGRFTLAMKHYGFKQSNSDHTLFLKQRGNLITCLIIYVDDMIITGNDKEEITKLKKNLFTEFEMKDLGRLKYFLGIEVLRSKQVIFMYQKKYVLDLLAEIGMVDCKPADTPMIMNQKLYTEKKARLADKGRYQRMVEKLIYLSHTQPDIAHAVGVVSKFMHQPQKAHIKAVLRIIRYLKGTAGHGVLFKQNGHLETQLYTDADWAGDKGDRRSTSEAEFRGIARRITKVLWIRKLLTEIGYPPQEPSKVTSDNKAAIQISENPVQHDRTKHIEIDQHFIKEKLEAEVITLPFVRSQDQLADILTKAVNERTLHECLGKLNFGNPTIQLEGEC